jgi:hypothetical protein|tara:strand:+ start:4291 stop:4647 length:357 start_codon:yes stop_codon:yes gene_type:complete
MKTKTFSKKVDGPLYYSAALEDRLSDALIENSGANEKPGSSIEEEVVVHTPECDNFYQIVAWSDNTVTIIVPHDHLHNFFQNCSNLTFSLYNVTKSVIKTHANKKDGVWFTSLFYEDI